MGMRVQNGQSAANSAATGSTAFAQRQQDFKSMMSALKSGDLNAAQQAYSSLTQGRGTPPANSPLAQIGQALQNGDLAGAQKAAQSMHGAHHGHHHGGSEASSGSTAAPAPAPAPAGTGTVIINAASTAATANKRSFMQYRPQRGVKRMG